MTIIRSLTMLSVNSHGFLGGGASYPVLFCLLLFCPISTGTIGRGNPLFAWMKGHVSQGHLVHPQFARVKVTYRDPVSGQMENWEEVSNITYGTASTRELTWGRLVHVSSPDGSHLGCQPPTNEPKYRWIALIKRGECLFHDKIHIHAVAGTAEAAVVHNYANTINVMLHWNQGAQAVLIPRPRGKALADIVDRGACVLMQLGRQQDRLPELEYEKICECDSCDVIGPSIMAAQRRDDANGVPNEYRFSTTGRPSTTTARPSGERIRSTSPQPDVTSPSAVDIEKESDNSQLARGADPIHADKDPMMAPADLLMAGIQSKKVVEDIKIVSGKFRMSTQTVFGGRAVTVLALGAALVVTGMVLLAVVVIKKRRTAKSAGIVVKMANNKSGSEQVEVTTVEKVLSLGDTDQGSDPDQANQRHGMEISI